jgi:Ubiquitin-Binding Zinc Finger
LSACRRCGKAMAQDCRAEHSDWHFADDLQRVSGGTQRLGPRDGLNALSGASQSASQRREVPGATQNGSGGGSRKRQQSPVTINALLSRHKRKSGAG